MESNSREISIRLLMVHSGFYGICGKFDGQNIWFRKEVQF